MPRYNCAPVVLCCLLAPQIAASAALRAQPIEPHDSLLNRSTTAFNDSQSSWMSKSAPDSVLRSRETAEQTALVEVEATAGSKARFGEEVISYLSERIGVPGIADVAKYAGKMLVSDAFKGLFKLGKASKLKYAKVAMERVMTTISYTVTSIASFLMTLNIPALLVSLPFLAAKVTTLAISWMRLSRLETGIDLQMEMCSTISPLLLGKDGWVRMNKNLQRMAAKTSALQKIARMLLERKDLTLEECLEAFVQFATLTNSDERVQSDPGASTEALCSTVRTKVIGRIAMQKRAIDQNIAIAMTAMDQVNENISKWVKKYSAMMKAWKKEADGMSDTNLSLMFKLANAVEDFLGWCWNTIKNWVMSFFVGKKGIEKLATGTEVRLREGDEVQRWSPSSGAFVSVKRADEDSHVFGGSKDAMLYDNTVDDLSNAMTVTMKMVQDSAENPFHMALDRSRVWVFGFATIRVFAKLKTNELPYTGPVLLQPLPKETTTFGITTPDEKRSGWQVQIATPRVHTEGECMDERFLYGYRKNNIERITESFCQQTVAMVASSALASFERASETLEIEYSTPKLGGQTLGSGRDFIRLYSIVPSFSPAALDTKVEKDLDELQFGREGSEYCISLFEKWSEGNWFWPGSTAEQHGTKILKEAGMNLPTGMSNAEFAFTSLGEEKLQLCSNNAAEAMVWLCTMANIGIEMPVLGQPIDKVMVFIGDGSAKPKSSLAINFESGSVYVDRSRKAAGGGIDIRGEFCKSDEALQSSAHRTSPTAAMESSTVRTTPGVSQSTSDTSTAVVPPLPLMIGEDSEAMQRQMERMIRATLPEDEVKRVLDGLVSRAGRPLSPQSPGKEMSAAAAGGAGADTPPSPQSLSDDGMASGGGGDPAEDDTDTDGDLVAQIVAYAEEYTQDDDKLLEELIRETEIDVQPGPNLIPRLQEAAQSSIDEADSPSEDDICTTTLIEALSEPNTTPDDDKAAAEAYRKCRKALLKPSSMRPRRMAVAGLRSRDVQMTLADDLDDVQDKAAGR